MNDEEKKKLDADMQFLRTITSVTATISGLGFLAIGVAMMTGSSIADTEVFSDW